MDKFTAVTMFDKVQAKWEAETKALVGPDCGDETRSERVWLEAASRTGCVVEMAVVVSAENGEEEKFAARGLTSSRTASAWTRWMATGHDIEQQLQRPGAPAATGVCLRAMWSTGLTRRR